MPEVTDDAPPSLPAAMDAAVYTKPGEVKVETRPLPDVGPDDLLIEVSHCGVCGSDIHMILEGWGRPGTIEGHEYTGVVAAVGERVQGWTVGDPVVGGPDRRCGACRFCRAGRPSLCEERGTPGKGGPWQGAFAGYKSLPADNALHLPDGLTLREAALAEPLAVALHGISRSGILGATPWTATDGDHPGHTRDAPSSAMVFGAGPIGALLIAVLAARGVPDIAVVEPSPGRQRLATDVGATRVLGPDQLDLPHLAEPERMVAGAVDVVFECSGKRAAMEAGLGQLRRGGMLVLVGAGIEGPRFDPNRILLNELLITGSFVYDAGGFDTALDLLASGAIPTARLIDPQDVPLSGLLDAMVALAAGDIAGKVLVRPASRG